MRDKIKELIEVRKLTKLEIIMEIEGMNKVQLVGMSENELSDFNLSLAVLEKEYEIFTLVIQDLEELLSNYL